MPVGDSVVAVRRGSSVVLRLYRGSVLVADFSSGTPGSTGLVLPGAGASVNDGSGTAWVAPENITAQDSVRTTCNRSAAGTSHLLRASGFNFSSIPDAATITGVEVRVRHDYSSVGTSVVRDSIIRLTKDGSTLVGDNKADTGTNWPKALDTNVNYGASDDDWNAALTVAQVKSASFGVMIEANFVSVEGSTNARVDAVWMNIHYVS